MDGALIDARVAQALLHRTHLVPKVVDVETPAREARSGRGVRRGFARDAQPSCM